MIEFYETPGGGVHLPAKPVSVVDGVAKMASGVKLKLATSGRGFYLCTVNGCRNVHHREKAGSRFKGNSEATACCGQRVCYTGRANITRLRLEAEKRGSDPAPTVTPPTDGALVALDDVEAALLLTVGREEADKALAVMGYERRWRRT